MHDTVDDVSRLHALGYAQELRRSMSAFSNFAVSFTIISVVTGCLTLYGFGMSTGGPAAMSLGWPLVGLFVLLVGLSMAEVCSSYPTAGGLHYWSAKLAQDGTVAWSWFTGWFNLLGQVAITAGIDFGLATFIVALLNLATGLNSAPAHVIAVYAVVLIAHGLFNSFGVRLVALLNNVSVWWHIGAIAAIVITLSLLPAHHQSAPFVFTHFVNQTGWGSGIYVFALGLLLAQYTFTGYDASAHMAEETRAADVSGPRGIVLSIAVSLVAGWVLLIGVTFAIQNYDGALRSSTGVPIAQIFVDALGNRGGELLLLAAIGAAFWHQINRRTRTPTNSIWLSVGGAFLLGLPYLWNSTAFSIGPRLQGSPEELRAIESELSRYEA